MLNNIAAFSAVACMKQVLSNIQRPVSIRAGRPYDSGKTRIWLRQVLFTVGFAVLFSLAACANQSSVSQPAEPLSVTNAPGAGAPGQR